MSQVILYQSEDGRTKLNVRLEGHTVWLSQKQLTELYGKAKGTISEHIKHIFEDGELEEISVVRYFRTTATDGKSYEVAHYNLDMVLPADLAKAHAEQEFIEFRKQEDQHLESDFDQAVKNLPQPKSQPKRKSNT